MATKKMKMNKLDLDKIRERLEFHKNQGKGGSKNSNTKFWKPEEGENTIRVVPTADGDAFRDFWYHYNLGAKAGYSTLCPKRNLDEECPICDFASSLWHDHGDDESRKQAKGLFARQRFFVPVLVRGEEDQGVRLYGYGKKTYEMFLGMLVAQLLVLIILFAMRLMLGQGYE